MTQHLIAFEEGFRDLMRSKGVKKEARHDFHKQVEQYQKLLTDIVFRAKEKIQILRKEKAAILEAAIRRRMQNIYQRNRSEKGDRCFERMKDAMSAFLRREIQDIYFSSGLEVNDALVTSLQEVYDCVRVEVQRLRSSLQQDCEGLLAREGQGFEALKRGTRQGLEDAFSQLERVLEELE